MTLLSHLNYLHNLHNLFIVCLFVSIEITRSKHYSRFYCVSFVFYCSYCVSFVFYCFYCVSFHNGVDVGHGGNR